MTLREEAKILLKRAEDIQKTAHETVNRSTRQKMAETDNLMVFLKMILLNLKELGKIKCVSGTYCYKCTVCFIAMLATNLYM